MKEAQRSIAERNELVLKHQKIVSVVIHCLKRNPVVQKYGFENCRQEGQLGLIEAAATYNDKRSTFFGHAKKIIIRKILAKANANRSIIILPERNRHDKTTKESKKRAEKLISRDSNMRFEKSSDYLHPEIKDNPLENMVKAEERNLLAKALLFISPEGRLHIEGRLKRNEKKTRRKQAAKTDYKMNKAYIDKETIAIRKVKELIKVKE